MQCLDKWGDSNLTAAADKMWIGLADYYQKPETQDPWVDCLKDPLNALCFNSKYTEGKTAQ